MHTQDCRWKKSDRQHRLGCVTMEATTYWTVQDFWTIHNMDKEEAGMSIVVISNKGTVDGKNPANQLKLVVYPIIYMLVYIPGG